MANLVRCIECQHPISSEAWQCPRCGSQRPFGMHCTVCQTPVKTSEAITEEYEDHSYWTVDTNTRYFHESCFRAVNRIRIYDESCSLCKKVIKGGTLNLSDPIDYQTVSLLICESGCSNCGHPLKCEKNQLDYCVYCSRRLNLKEGSAICLEGTDTFTRYAHQICFTEKRKKENQYRFFSLDSQNDINKEQDLVQINQNGIDERNLRQKPLAEEPHRAKQNELKELERIREERIWKNATAAEIIVCFVIYILCLAIVGMWGFIIATLIISPYIIFQLRSSG